MSASLSSFAESLTVETAFTVLAVAKSLKAEGKDVVELEIGDSPFESTASAKASGIEAIETNQTHYCPSPGLPAFREAAAGFVREGETVRLSARIKDSNGTVGKDAIAFIAQKDGQPPEVAFTRPAVGYGPIEGTNFTLGFRAYDNVKVEQMRVFAGYGARAPEGVYHSPQYSSALHTVNTIEARDFEPITTGNIDTPEYRHKLNVLPRSAIAALLGFAAETDYPHLWYLERS